MCDSGIDIRNVHEVVPVGRSSRIPNVIAFGDSPDFILEQGIGYVYRAVKAIGAAASYRRRL